MTNWVERRLRREIRVIAKIFRKMDFVEFDANTRRIRIDFVQKANSNANLSFSPLC